MGYGYVRPWSVCKITISAFFILKTLLTHKSKMSRNFKLQILKISKEFSYKAWNFGKIKFTWLHFV